ncbi:MAG: aryl-sulfate sulfotransferase [Chitinophagales bacterium]
MINKFFIAVAISCLTWQISYAQFNYVSPVPGSKYHNPATNIILSNGADIDRQSISDNTLLQITGSISGNHRWKAGLSDDGKSVIIHPDPVFEYGENVSVTVHPKLRKEAGAAINGMSFSFEIREALTPEQAELRELSRLNDFMDSFGYDPNQKKEEEQFEIPDSFPKFHVGINNNAAPGRIFYCNQQELDEDDTNCFPAIIENDGTVIWTRDMSVDGHDFKLQHNGYLSYYSYGCACWKVIDSNYNEIDSVQCGNGYQAETNGHDVQMYADGHIFLLAVDAPTIDMTAYGGLADATVKGLIVQELDADGQVVFQWRSWDYFLFTDANQFNPLTNATVDYVHGNAVERDTDGNILISSRNMDEITKINRQTGEIMWRMGGENNQFTFVNDNIPQHFSQQHDVRRLANGNITILNNGNYLPLQISSAKEYQVDEINKVATLVWYYEHPYVNGLPVFSKASGNAQRLPNGNTMISWGTITFYKGLPSMTEVNMNKNIVWEMTFVKDGQKSYRTFKFDWDPCSRVSAFTMKALKKPGYMMLGWQPATGAISYLVRYRPVGSGNWITKNIAVPKIKIQGLIPGITYEWNLKTICSKTPLVTSTFSETKTFITAQRTGEGVDDQAAMINIYPNPTHSNVTIEFSNLEKEATVIIQNPLGQVLVQRNITPGKIPGVKIDLSDWIAGVYFISVMEGEKAVTQKLVIE